MDMPRSIGEQSRESMESVLKKKRKVLHWEGSVEKDGLKPRMKE